ncbi:NAD(P)-binding protein [Neorhizobium sp. NCHU2750]|uniref:FAD-dependent oxidoreductase n=1 Tax=Neorhizobium sp. NCHU2750 TaxID=1825976 RepID=UPI000E711ED9|nr:FAD-binding protein [Neorhizobium sp. NCHU2750]
MNDSYELQQERAPETEAFDAIILGAGVSGLVAASVLVKQSSGRIMVVDSYDRVGGNHLDWSRNGFTFDVGSLIFQDDSPLVKHFPELLEHYVHIHPSWGRLNPQRKITTYPISVKDDIIAAGPLVICRIMLSVLAARIQRKTMRNAKDFAAYWIGAYLLRRSGLENYMARFYGVAPDHIDLELAQKRMLWIKEHSSLTNLLRKMWKRRSPAQIAPPNKQLARPKAGYSALYEPVKHTLSQSGVAFRLGIDIAKLEKSAGRFVVTSSCGKTMAAARVISTIPINIISGLCGLAQNQPLQTITLISLYFSFSGNRGFAQSILYNFSYEAAWKRLTVYSDFYGSNEGREYFAVEVVANEIISSIELAEAEFRQHVAKNGIFDGDLRLEGGHVLDNAYPIYVHGAAANARQQIDILKQFGIESFGRHGAFNYQPTARVSTLEAEEALNYRHPDAQPA